MTPKLIGAIEAGGTKFVLALARSDGTVLERTRIATNSPPQTFAEMEEFFARAQERYGQIAGFGIASFGPIDIDPLSPDYGTFTTTPKPGWSGARFQDGLSRFDAPILVDTDVNGAALGEWLAGSGRGTRTLGYTTVGTGIGTGILSDGKALGGFSHYEAGHIRPSHDTAIDPFAGICPYHGDCLEGLASGPAIEARLGYSLDRLAGEELRQAVSLVAGYLADFTATLVLLHMPDRLIFGGGVMKAPGMIEQIRGKTEQALAGYVSHPRLSPGLTDYIVPPGLGDDAGLTGAIELGRRALTQPRH